MIKPVWIRLAGSALLVASATSLTSCSSFGLFGRNDEDPVITEIQPVKEKRKPLRSALTFWKKDDNEMVTVPSQEPAKKKGLARLAFWKKDKNEDVATIPPSLNEIGRPGAQPDGNPWPASSGFNAGVPGDPNRDLVYQSERNPQTGRSTLRFGRSSGPGYPPGYTGVPATTPDFPTQPTIEPDPLDPGLTNPPIYRPPAPPVSAIPPGRDLGGASLLDLPAPTGPSNTRLPPITGPQPIQPTRPAPIIPPAPAPVEDDDGFIPLVPRTPSEESIIPPS